MDLKEELDRETNAFAQANNNQLNAHNDKILATENIVSLIFREVYDVDEDFFDKYVRDILWDSSYMEDIVEQRQRYEYKEYIKKLCCFMCDLGDYVIESLDQRDCNADFKDEYLKIYEMVDQHTNDELYQIIFEKFNKNGSWTGF